MYKVNSNWFWSCSSHKFAVWSWNMWNPCDAAAIIFYLIGLSLRMKPSSMSIGRVIFCVDIVYWYLRILNILGVNKYLGNAVGWMIATLKMCMSSRQLQLFNFLLLKWLNRTFYLFLENKLKLQTFTNLNIGLNNYLFKGLIGYGFGKIINVLFFHTRDRRFKLWLRFKVEDED